MKKHRLIVVGYIGSGIGYLDIERAEAVRRYLASEHAMLDAEDLQQCPDKYISEFEFDDEFGVYSAWAIIEWLPKNRGKGERGGGQS